MNSAPWWPKIENLKLSYMTNTKPRKHHRMSQEIKTITEVLVHCPLVAKKIENLKLSYMINTKLRKQHKMSQGMKNYHRHT